MYIEKPYQTGSVIPRFHTSEQREKLAVLILVEAAEAKQEPAGIRVLALHFLDEALDALQRDNAEDFVQSFGQVSFFRKLLRRRR